MLRPLVGFTVLVLLQVVGIVFIVGCSDELLRLTEEDKVRAEQVVLSHVLNMWKNGSRIDSNRVFYVGCGAETNGFKDPPEDYIASLSNIPYHVKGFSSMSPLERHIVESGTISNISEVLVWVEGVTNRTQLIVCLSRSEGPLSGSCNKYLMEKRGGKWEILKRIDGFVK